MAGGGGPAPAKGGKKSVDFNVNLVPTIDLLSVLISFLLITAVWTQLARINASQVLPKTQNQPPPPPDEKEKDKKLYVFVTPDDISVNYTEEAPTVFKKTEDTLPIKLFREGIGEFAKRAKEPRKEQIVVVAPTDGTEYRTVIEVMDVLLDNSLTGMSIGDANVVRGTMPEDPNSPPPGGAPPAGGAPQ